MKLVRTVAIGGIVATLALAGCSNSEPSDPKTVQLGVREKAALYTYLDEQQAIYTKTPEQIHALAKHPSTVAEREIGDLAETTIEDDTKVVKANVKMIEARSAKDISNDRVKIRVELQTSLTLDWKKDPEESWNDMHTIVLNPKDGNYVVASDKTDPEGAPDNED